MIRHRFDRSSMAYSTQQTVSRAASDPAPHEKHASGYPQRMRRSSLSETAKKDASRDACVRGAPETAAGPAPAFRLGCLARRRRRFRTDAQRTPATKTGP